MIASRIDVELQEIRPIVREIKPIDRLKIAAQTGDAAAKTRYANSLYCGTDGVTDQKEAIKWYQQAAEEGDTEAEYMLGAALFHVEKNLLQSVKWIQKAEAKKYVKAISFLGYFLITGQGIAQDKNQGFELILSAAKQGSDIAQFNLAYCFQKGWGTSVDLVQAEFWYRKATDQGCQAAEVELANILYNEEEIEKKEEAIGLYKKAAAQGNKSSQNFLTSSQKITIKEEGVKITIEGPPEKILNFIKSKILNLSSNPSKLPSVKGLHLLNSSQPAASAEATAPLQTEERKIPTI